ncbi:hypothetical protein Aazo_2404 ['Nostoc azollae' 0708]|jgi:hypothetical protein|uniref:Uncharacterized protein n=1 Tax=Nostoc azollae (strain 0708) TaxID=551115 RepID=D7DY10_NOSA0|nr:hypothetical protein Aazo_2404 ['Nostoc azollae' 0708]
MYILQYYTPSGKLEERIVNRDSLYLELTRSDSHFFKPKALAEFCTDQLTGLKQKLRVKRSIMGFRCSFHVKRT